MYVCLSIHTHALSHTHTNTHIYVHLGMCAAGLSLEDAESRVEVRFVPDAMEALTRSGEEECGEIIDFEARRAVEDLTERGESIDSVAFAMFSMAFAAPRVQDQLG